MAKIIKIIVILAFGAACLIAAANFAESYAAEISAKEQTLAEAVMKSQLEAEIKKAEEQAAKELEEQGQILVTEVLETKPPVTTTTATVTTAETETETESETAAAETEITTIPATETVSETVQAEEEIITEFTRGGLLPADRTGIPTRTMFTLTESEQKLVVNYLIDHYFLDGYKYSAEEIRPALKEKKQLAAEMEGSVIKTINMIFNNVSMNDISAMLSADYGSLKSEVTEIREEFREKYSDADSYGEEFGELYEDSLKYFDRLIKAIENIESTANKYKNAANPLLALGLLASSLEDVIIPEVMAVLEQSFDLVEASQGIFLEGTQGTKLLTRDEVRDIISNPGLALYVELN